MRPALCREGAILIEGGRGDSALERGVPTGQISTEMRENISHKGLERAGRLVACSRGRRIL